MLFRALSRFRITAIRGSLGRFTATQKAVAKRSEGVVAVSGGYPRHMQASRVRQFAGTAAGVGQILCIKVARAFRPPRRAGALRYLQNR